MKTYYLRPEGTRWILTMDTGRPVSSFATKSDALRSCARRVSSEFGILIIRRADGSIEEERRYPRPGGSDNL
jgi:hypothetical protein